MSDLSKIIATLLLLGTCAFFFYAVERDWKLARLAKGQERFAAYTLAAIEGGILAFGLYVLVIFLF